MNRISEGSIVYCELYKKDRRQKQEELFPQLEEEIAKGREALLDGTVWNDQTDEAYKKEVVKKAEPLIHSRVTPRQRTSLID